MKDQYYLINTLLDEALPSENDERLNTSHMCLQVKSWLKIFIQKFKDTEKELFKLRAVHGSSFINTSISHDQSPAKNYQTFSKKLSLATPDVKSPDSSGRTSSLSGSFIYGHWQEDKEANCCNKCLIEFWVLSWKHHCWVCGKIFCKKCSSHYVLM